MSVIDDCKQREDVNASTFDVGGKIGAGKQYPGNQDTAETDKERSAHYEQVLETLLIQIYDSVAK